MSFRRFWVALLLPLALTACGGSGSSFGPDPAPLATAAVVATRAPDFGSGAISLVEAQTPFTARNNLPPSETSDILVRSGGDHYFVIQRFGTDRILRFADDDPNTPVYSYSTQDPDDTESSNPADLLILSPTKAYLLRYGSDALWIVNPSAASEAEFKIGEIDLSAYDPDGIPEMTAGVIKQGILYVLMQRLENFFPTRNGYVAIIDTATDQQIDTGVANPDDLPGIELPLRNPGQVLSNPGNDDLVILSGGGVDPVTFDPLFNGGILRFHTVSYDTDLLVDDGEADSPPFGQFTDLAITATDRAYFVGSQGFFGTQTLFRFDPTGNAAPVPVGVAQDIGIGTLAADSQRRLWLGRTETATPGLTVLDASGQTETVIEDLIDTVLTPINIDFLSSP